MAEPSQITDAIEYMLNRLQPLRDIGVLCSDTPTEQAIAGRVNRRGRVTIYYLSDTNFTTDYSLGSLTQEYQSNFVFHGRIRNLKSSSGMRIIREFLYAATIGITLPGYYKQSFAQSFITEKPNKNEYPFIFTIGAVSRMVVNVCDDDLFVDPTDPISPIAAGAELSKIEFIGAVRSVLDPDNESPIDVQLPQP